jgi:hypothetical protein
MGELRFDKAMFNTATAVVQSIQGNRVVINNQSSNWHLTKYPIMFHCTDSNRHVTKNLETQESRPVFYLSLKLRELHT